MPYLLPILISSIMSSNKQDKKRSHDDTLVDPIQSLEASMLKVNQDILALKKRREDITARQEALSTQNGGATCKPSDIIKLNISSCLLFARRDTLTCVKGSRLDGLFSGRWENQLLRDDKGRVFMDLDADAFKKVLAYLYTIKTSLRQFKEGRIPYPAIESAVASEHFEEYVRFFGLADPSKGSDPSRSKKAKDTSKNGATSDDHQSLIHNTNMELDEMEKSLEAEENFVSCFMDNKQKKAVNSPSSEESSVGSEVIIDSTESMATVEAVASSSNTSSRELSIIHLFLNGEIVSVKRATLCYDPDSKVAEDFSNDTWVNENTVIEAEGGKSCVLIEQPTAQFKVLLNHIRLRYILKEAVEVEAIICKSTCSADRVYMKAMLLHFFPLKADVLSVNTYDSNILMNVEDEVKLKEWLAAVDRDAEPKMLFRASTNGWDASDFHRCCDGKGATITVVKTTKGYVLFGGYSDVAWQNTGSYSASKDAFLFSFKNDAGKDAVRMSVEPGHERNAIYNQSDYGPTWGNGCALHIASNANQGDHSYSNFGLGYQFPPGISNCHFLTGERTFQVAEYEVYQV